MADAPLPLPAFTSWPTFPFEGELRVKKLAEPVDEEPPRHGEDPSECSACRAPDSAYIWISERWRVRSLDRPTGLPMVLILESRSHLDMGDLTNLLAAELGVLTVRLERAIRSLDGVARVHVNRWGDGSAHLHVWFLARPSGRLQLRGTFLSLWDDILPRIPEFQWRENLALVAAWLADFGGEALAEPPHIDWQSPALLNLPNGAAVGEVDPTSSAADSGEASDDGGMGSSVVAAETAELTRELHAPEAPGRDGATTVVVSRGTGQPVSRETGPDASGGSDTDGTVPRGTDRTVKLPDARGGETVRIPTARTAGGETVNLSEVSGGETVRFSTGSDGEEETDGSATMRFPASGVTGSGTQTMVFPTGDALAAARAEADKKTPAEADEKTRVEVDANAEAAAETAAEEEAEKNAGDDPRRPAASKS